MAKRVLVIEDDEAIRSNVLDLLEAEGFDGVGAPDGERGLALARGRPRPDLIICDIMLPGIDGYAVLAEIRRDPALATLPLVFLTAKADRADMRAGMNLGADDYLTKPFTRAELLEAIHTRLRRAAELAAAAPSASGVASAARPARASEPPASSSSSSGQAAEIVVEEPAMRELHRLLERVAPGSIHVLLLGETGVGKEVFAERLHALSPRRDRPLLRLNCSAFTETLLESELFGHERGSFTGASQTKPGLLESAEGGTVFLDEVGELSPALQSKLLRVLEERMVRRIGALKPRAVDVRFVAATNRDLEAEIARGAFRSDLYFRLSGATLVIPPLRERPAEIEPLARRFLALAAARERLAHPPPLLPEALAQLRAYRWPGNIRELRNVMERAVLLAAGGPITPALLPGGAASTGEFPRPRLGSEPEQRAGAGGATAGAGAGGTSLRSSVELAERERIVEALRATDGNQTEAAKLLGIARRTLINKMELHDLPRPRKG